MAELALLHSGSSGEGTGRRPGNSRIVAKLLTEPRLAPSILASSNDGVGPGTSLRSVLGDDTDSHGEF